jgi:formamidopyrimidine-DNA glycosylase
MPEYPDITIYIERLEAFVQGQRLEQIRFASPFFLRTAEPPIKSIHGARIRDFERMGKRIVFVFDDEQYLVLHLMIAGRLRWRKKGCKLPGKVGLAVFDFPNGSLLITEAGSKKRASLHFVKDRSHLDQFNPGGLEVLDATIEAFRKVLPILLTKKMDKAQIERLYHATRDTLEAWTVQLRDEVGSGFPEKVTAFRDGMAVHGRYQEPCPECGTSVQRIRYASNETNYCPNCQTGGKLLADRSMSRLLKKDWPRTLEELETRQQQLARDLS